MFRNNACGLQMDMFAKSLDSATIALSGSLLTIKLLYLQRQFRRCLIYLTLRILIVVRTYVLGLIQT